MHLIPLLLEQESLHFCFELGSNNYPASFEYLNKPAFVFKEIIDFLLNQEGKFYIKVSLSPSTLPLIPIMFSEWMPLTKPNGKPGKCNV